MQIHNVGNQYENKNDPDAATFTLQKLIMNGSNEH